MATTDFTFAYIFLILPTPFLKHTFALFAAERFIKKMGEDTHYENLQ